MLANSCFILIAILFFSINFLSGCGDDQPTKKVNVTLNCEPGENQASPDDDDDDTAGDDDDDTAGDDDDDTAGDDDDDTAGDDDDDTAGDDDDDSVVPATQILNQVAAPGPAPSFTGQVSVTIDQDAEVFIEYDRNFLYGKRTPSTQVLVNQSSIINLQGLVPDTNYYARVVALASDGSRIVGSDLTFKTAAWARDPAEIPVITDLSSGTAASKYQWNDQEVFCMLRIVSYRESYFSCLDRDGNLVTEYYNQCSFLGYTPLGPGELISPCVNSEGGGYQIVGFNLNGEQTLIYPLSDLSKQSTYTHQLLTRKIVKITEGQLAGSVAVLTSAIDYVRVQPPPSQIDPGDYTYFNYPYMTVTEPVNLVLAAAGIIVFDPSDGTVLWDWSLHGELGDNIPATPKLLYTHFGFRGAQPLANGTYSWGIGSGMDHGISEAGDFFVVSLPYQDAVIKIDVATSEVDWVAGIHAGFDLVNNIDSIYSFGLPDHFWMFSPEHLKLTYSESNRIELFIYDSGYNRPFEILPDDYTRFFSRIIGLKLNENNMKAENSFAYGSPELSSPDNFLQVGRGTFDFSPNWDRIFYAQKIGGVNSLSIVELSNPESEKLWEMEFSQQTVDEITYFPSVYDIGK